MNLALLVTLAVAVGSSAIPEEVEPVGLVPAEVESLRDVFVQERSGKECTTLQFKCNNNACIYADWQCDGEYDCADGSDELKCECSLDTDCPKDLICINSYGINGRKGQCQECTNRLSESECNTYKDRGLCRKQAAYMKRNCRKACGVCGACTGSHYKCNNGKCISKSLVGDRFDDCGDWSDEGACRDTDGTRTDRLRLHCSDYSANFCGGAYDDDDFKANDFCCACRGGIWDKKYLICDSDTEFICDNGKCIKESGIGDGKNDCGDNSDERESKCSHCHDVVTNGQCKRDSEQRCVSLTGTNYCSKVPNVPKDDIVPCFAACDNDFECPWDKPTCISGVCGKYYAACSTYRVYTAGKECQGASYLNYQGNRDTCIQHNIQIGNQFAIYEKDSGKCFGAKYCRETSFGHGYNDTITYDISSCLVCSKDADCLNGFTCGTDGLCAPPLVTYPGWCLYGDNLEDSFESASDEDSFAECEEECQKTKGCVAFSYETPTPQEYYNCYRYRGGPYTFGSYRVNTTCYIMPEVPCNTESDCPANRPYCNNEGYCNVDNNDCKCKSSWTWDIGGECAKEQHGCTNCDEDPSGNWCIVANPGCKTVQENKWSYCASGDNIIRDDQGDNKKCAYSGSNRVFVLRGGDALEHKCRKACTINERCIAFSGIWNSWCIGCDVELTDNHNGAIAFKKTV